MSIDWNTLSENERRKVLQKGQMELDDLKRKIDEKQKQLCEKRATIPEICKQSFIEEKVTLLGHAIEGELPIVHSNKPSLDAQTVIGEIQNRLKADEYNLETENALKEHIAKAEKEIEETNQKCLEVAANLLSMKYIV